MNSATNKTRALNQAARQAAEALCGVDMSERCSALGLDGPDGAGRLTLEMFGLKVIVQGPDCAGRMVETQRPMHPIDRVLLLHYLLHDRPVRPTGRWIAFREFTGGQFYQQPFENRTSKPLIDAMGGETDLLPRRLEGLNWRSIGGGDFAAAVRVFGNVDLAVIYNCPDDEFPASASVLFDSSLQGVFCAEDAVAIAGRLSQKLANQPCTTCSGCGLCDTPPADS